MSIDRKDRPSAPGLAPERFPRLSAMRLAPLSVALAGAGTLASMSPAHAGADLQADFYTVLAGHTLSGVNVLDNDTGYNNIFVCGFSQPHLGNNANPFFGTANVAANGSLVFTPSAGFSGVLVMTYEDCIGTPPDGNSIGVASVILTVAPDIEDDQYSTPYEQAVAGNVLDNDVGNTLAVIAFSQPAHGSLPNGVDSKSGKFNYVPAPGFSGIDSFTYTAWDVIHQNATATVHLLVGPNAVDDNLSTPYAKPVSGNVLGNDVGNGLHVVGSGLPAHGSVPGGVAPDGSFTYVPNPGYTGTDSFQYSEQDQYGSNASAVVHLTITPVAFNFYYSGEAFDNNSPSPPPGAGTSQHTPINNGFLQPLTVIVEQDAVGVPGVEVCFTVVPNGNGASATLSSAQAFTDANGVASVVATANGTPGSYTVNAAICGPGAQPDSVLRPGGIALKAASDATLVFVLTNDPIAQVPTLGGGLLAALSALLAFLGWRRRA